MTMSIGWMTQVASIPEAPPLTKGLTVFHTPVAAAAACCGCCCCCFASAIPAPDRAALCSGRGGAEAKRTRRRERGRCSRRGGGLDRWVGRDVTRYRKRKKKWLLRPGKVRRGLVGDVACGIAVSACGRGARAVRGPKVAVGSQGGGGVRDLVYAGVRIGSAGVGS